MTDPAHPDAGSVLRQARIRRGQSLEVVSQQTRIPKKMLEALETNRFDEFPAVVYLRGFLKNYCDHLDLDFDPLWARVDPNKPKPAAAAGAPEAKAEPAPPPSRRPEPGEYRGPEVNASQLLPFLLLGGLLVGGVAFWMLSGRKPGRPEAPPTAPQPPREIAPMHGPKEMVLRVVARHDAWMQVQTDGVLRFQGRAPSGLSLDWKAMDGFLLRAKDPSALTVYLDGKEVALTDSLKNSAGDYKLARP